MSICGISCGIFREEIEYLKKNGKVNIDFQYFNSLLHLRPEKLDEIVTKITDDNRNEYILITGDCSPGILELSDKQNVKRPACINCVEIILGTKIYKKYRKDGAFFLMPEWTERWEEIFKKDLGFDKKIATMIMNDMHTKLIYIDTGLREINFEKLEEFSEYVGLDYEIIKPGLDTLIEFINTAEKELKK